MSAFHPLSAIAGLVGIAALNAAPAQAADARLDDANAHLVKAEELLKAAEDPGAERPFDGHAATAIRLLQQAQAQIDLAKKAADMPKPARRPRGQRRP
jgi:hypothetical protein